MTAGAQHVTNSTRREKSSLLIFGNSQATESKIFCFTILEIRIITPAIPARTRGVSRSSRCVGSECGGRFGVRRFLTPDENAKAYGEVVWSWRRDAGAKFLRSKLPTATKMVGTSLCSFAHPTNASPGRWGAPPSRGSDLLILHQRRQHLRLRHAAHDHRLVAAADRDFVLRQGVSRKARGGANLVRDHGFAGELLGHVLQPCRDVDGIAERGEHHMIAVADV